MSPGFFLDIAKNTDDKCSYEILPVKDVVDIPTRNIWPIIQNIVRPTSLDCDAAPMVKENDNFLLFGTSRVRNYSLKKN